MHYINGLQDVRILMDNRPAKLRDDLIIQEVVNQDGSKHYVIKDPVTNAFFKIGEPEYFIISCFDGINTVSQIAASFKEKFNIDLEKSEISAFAGQMEQQCFLDNELTRRELLKKQKEADENKPKSLLERVIYIKVKAINPSKLFDRLIGHIGFFFSKKYILGASLLILFSFLIMLYNMGRITDDILNMINIEGAILLYIAVLFVVILHEFAHGLTCRHFGGNVQEIGFLLMYFQPAFYCNVSDAWLFPEKRKRLWVSFSGGFFQMFIWAVAVIIWRITQSGIFINKFALAVMSFSGIASLFNFNPLMRFDGYYMLSDYVEIPNLRRKARDFWLNSLKAFFMRYPDDTKSIPARERRIFFYYGILSFSYIVFVLGYILSLLGIYLVENYGGTGFIIFAALMIFMFRYSIMGLGRGIKKFIRARADLFHRRRYLSATLIIIGLLIVISIFVRTELRIKGELVLNPMSSQLLKYDSRGYVELITYSAYQTNSDKQREVSVFTGEYSTTSLVPLVNVGDQVKKDQIIARLANSETALYINEYTATIKKANEELEILKQGARPEEISRARNNVDEYEAQLEQATAELQRKNEMFQKHVIARQVWEDAYTDSIVKDARVRSARNDLDLLLAGNRPEEIRAKQAEIDQLQSQIDFHRRQQDFYEIKSAINGVVLSLDTGEIVCEIADLDTLEAQIVLPEQELADIKPGQDVKFKTRGYPGKSFYGTVSRLGGKIITDEKNRRIFYVFCRVVNDEKILQPGMTGVANIYCGKRTIGHLINRKFFRTIRTEFWDWFDWF
jgi:putative peptide zinc metalloprotease protein